MNGYTGWRPMPSGQYRSRGESTIANLLGRAGVPYHYEPRLILYAPPQQPTPPDISLRWTRPDFYLPRQRTVIEYAGRMDLPDYRERHAEKVQLYAYNGVRCYEVFPDDLRRSYWAHRLLDAVHTPWTPTNYKPDDGLPINGHISSMHHSATLDDRLLRKPRYAGPTRYDRRR
ncbi:MAG: hypothetical protein ACE37H_07955 [Phycisphaeraceae bacterium]